MASTKTVRPLADPAAAQVQAERFLEVEVKKGLTSGAVSGILISGRNPRQRKNKMANEVKAVPVQKTFFDLDTLQDVTVRKTFVPSAPVTSLVGAAARLGNDQARLLEIVNAGLVSEEAAAVRANPDGWYLVEGAKMTDKPFTGTPANSKIANPMILTYMKYTVAPSLGLKWEDANAEQKKAIREATIKFIQDTPIIREGLKISAALKGDEDDEPESEGGAASA
jgi:hypothetical protein